MLRHFADLSYDEMAAALDIPVKTVKSRLHSARQSIGRAVVWMGRTEMTPQDEARLDAALNDLAAADSATAGRIASGSHAQGAARASRQSANTARLATNMEDR